MKIKNIIASLGLLASFSLANDYFVQANYGYYDGRANSNSNSADIQTTFPSIELGMKNKNLNYYLSYDQIRWNDAKAQDLMLNVDYLIPSNSFEYYLGLGIGSMRYEVDFLSDDETKAVASAKAGINYELSKTYYVSGGLRYLYTNGIEIKDSNNIYSSLDNFVGLELGFGFRF